MTRAKQRRYSGLTLVEVLLGLTLLGTLLVASLLVNAQATAQEHKAELRQRACEKADRLVAEWFAGQNGGIPLEGRGWLDEQQGLEWRTEELKDDTFSEFGGKKVRLTVVSTKAGNEPAILSLDLVTDGKSFGKAHEKPSRPDAD